ncbi:MAG: ribosome silencing factor [Gemmatimonadales bacterium]
MTSRGRLKPAAPQPPADVIRAVGAALADRKAIEVTVLDLRGLSGATDFFVIASGTSDTHVRGIADHVLSALGPKGIKPHHVEGLEGGRWVLLDYIDFVVHLFHPELREFYQLERLWSDAPVLAPGTEG